MQIANDGTIAFREGRFKERVSMNYYFSQRFASDTVKLEVLRNKEKLELDCSLWIPQPLVPSTLLRRVNVKDSMIPGIAREDFVGDNGTIIGGLPSYLVIGGLVFVTLCKEYLQQEFNTEHMRRIEGWSEEFKLLASYSQSRREEEEEIVLLSQVIAHPCNIGYELQRNLHLTVFNDQKVTNLKRLKQLLDNCRSSGDSNKPMVFEFSGGEIIVLNSNDAFSAQSQICREHFIPHECSSDLI
jgi:PDZ domain